MQFQYGELNGPYLAMFPIDVESLRQKCNEASIQCTVVHAEDRTNYVALLVYDENISE